MHRLVMVAAFLAYVFFAQDSILSTWGHFRDPRHRFWPLDIFRPHLYDERGNELRVRSIRIIFFGALALIAVSVLCLRP